MDHVTHGRPQRASHHLARVAAALLAALALTAAGPLQGQGRGADNGPANPPAQGRNFDARISENAAVEHAPSAGQLAAIERLGEEIPEMLVRFEPTTGATQAIANPVGYLTASRGGHPRDIALGFVAEQREALGLEPQDLEGLEITDEVFSAVTGATHYYLGQTLDGIPVYNGQLQVHVNRDNKIIGVNNGFLPGLRGAANTLRAARGAERAVAAAADHLGLDLPGTPAVLSRGDDPRQTTVIDGTGLSQEDVTARLVLVPINRGTARLAWNFQLQTLDSQHHYDLNVDAVSGKVWTRFDWTADGTYRVYDEPDESPLHGSQVRTLVVNPEDATASPNGWFAGGTMAGNNVHACPDANGNNACDSDPQCAGTTCDFPINLGQQPSTYIPAATANLFYWNNHVHDVQYQYGFDEAGGNFQENNFGRGGAGSDSVNADAQDGSGNCNANFSTPTSTTPPAAPATSGRSSTSTRV